MSMTNSDSILYCDTFQDLIGEDVLQVLKCGICLEFYDNPVVLPCGHTFCYNCLLQMGKHANRNKKIIPVHDLTIGCPNCRCPIFVVALLKRDVTLNYPVQSLIDGLKARREQCKPNKKMVEEGTNTETDEINSEENKKSSKIPNVTDKEFEKISNDFDRFVSALQGGSIVNDAFFSIEKIRNEFSNNMNNNWADKNISTRNISNLSQIAPPSSSKLIQKNFMYKPNIPSKASNVDVNFDPAIVSYSVSGSGVCPSGLNLPKPKNLSIF